MTDVVTAELTVEAPVAVEPLFTFKNITAPFTADGNTVNVNKKQLLRHVGHVTIINSTVRSSLTIEQTEAFDYMMMELLQSNRTIVRVMNFNEFFDGPAQFEKILKSDDETNLKLSDAIGLNLTYHDLSIITEYNELKANIIAFYAELQKSMKPAYVFVEGQEHTKLELRTRANRRQVQTPGGYWIGETGARRLWDAAYAFWSSEDSHTRSSTTGPSIRHSDYSRSATIYRQSVTVGCQQMTRYQVEQAALALGFI
jgi:hypothetical protein